MTCLACAGRLQPAADGTLFCERCGSRYRLNGGSLVPAAAMSGMPQPIGAGEPVGRPQRTAAVWAGVAALAMAGGVAFMVAGKSSGGDATPDSPAAPAVAQSTPQALQASQQIQQLSGQLRDLTQQLANAHTDAERAAIQAQIDATTQQIQSLAANPSAMPAAR
jgi:hypothetical protein